MFRLKLSLVFIIFFFTLFAITWSVSALLTAKYIFLFIGDGMGFPQVELAKAFYGRLNMYELKVKGELSTYSADRGIPDSASSATALATGYKTLNGILSMDPSKARKLKTIAHMAKERGMKVGIITNTPLDDATPAAFYSNQPSRLNYYEISLDLINSGFDYLAGGKPLGSFEKYRNGRVDILELAKSRGFLIIKDEESFKALGPKGKRVMVLNQAPAIYYEIDRPSDSISLSDLLEKGIEVLYNPLGFLMIVEGGKIDWACHANDAMTAIAEVKALDEAVRVALDFYKKHENETLIVVTADHETGGMEVDLSANRYKELILQRVSYAKFNSILSQLKSKSKSYSKEELLLLIERYFGIVLDVSELDLTEKLTQRVIRILNERSGIRWKTRGHTNSPVPVFAHGVKAELFSGSIDNTDIAKNIMKIAGLGF